METIIDKTPIIRTSKKKIAIAMAIFFLLVLIMGVLSIMVSIHEQLSAVRKILTEKLEVDTDAREIHLNPDT